MSFSGVDGGFQGGNALLAFAAVQQGRMNEEMTEAMRIADLRSQMAGDLADIKAHLEHANGNLEEMPDVAKELQAFMDKYEGEPALDDVTSTVGNVRDDVCLRVSNAAKAGEDIVAYQPDEIEWFTNDISEKLDAAGTNDQLAMIHIKQLNDNINNSSGMVSGIIESRQNSTASIINNIA